MLRPALVALTCLVALPAAAETSIPGAKPKAGSEAPLVNPSTLAVNEAAIRKVQAETDARAKAWDAKLRKTMAGVCKGC